MKIEEGYMPFLGHKTYFRIVGENSNGKLPLLLLHGGPGSTHNYFEVLDVLASEGRQIISYDQIGCGNSFVDGHEELWNSTTWLNELEALVQYLGIAKCHLLGQSWGAMMIVEGLITRKLPFVSSAILSSGTCSCNLWSREQHRLISFMPADEQLAIKRAELSGNFEFQDYLKANDHYTRLYACDAPTADSPKCLRRNKRFGTEAYNVAWGPNEYTPLGNLKNFEFTDRLHEISVPCLIISGTNDESTPLISKTMFDRIPNADWELLEGARHLTFVDCNEEYCRILNRWMQSKENG